MMNIAKSEPKRKKAERRIAQLNVGRRKTARTSSGRPCQSPIPFNAIMQAKMPPAIEPGTHQVSSQKNLSPSERPMVSAEMPAIKSRSEEHTSELQSLMRISYAVFCLKKKNKKNHKHNIADKSHN